MGGRKMQASAAAMPHSGTPKITVFDNRSLPVRILEYNRTPDSDVIDELITQSTRTLSGSLECSFDPRMFLQKQGSASAAPNTRAISSLQGEALFTESGDSGTQARITNIEGQTVWSVNANGVQTYTQYDVLGRPSAVFETAANNPIALCRDRFVYGETVSSSESNNLRGRLVRHYDSAGLVLTDSYSIHGKLLTQSRQLLENLDNHSNWPTGENSMVALLTPESYETKWEYDALGQVLCLTDAKGNQRNYTYTLQSRPYSAHLTLKGKSAQAVVSQSLYDADGQLSAVEMGNNSTATYTYDANTKRLIRMQVSRKLSDGSVQMLQDLNYTHDAVGNILTICDKTQKVRYYRNQRVSPENRYVYDSLYRKRQILQP